MRDGGRLTTLPLDRTEHCTARFRLSGPSFGMRDRLRTVERVALLSLHSSPIAPLGRSDAGGMNLYVRRLADELAGLGLQVDLFTRRTDTQLPSIVELGPNTRLIHLNAGLPQLEPNLGCLDSFLLWPMVWKCLLGVRLSSTTCSTVITGSPVSSAYDVASRWARRSSRCFIRCRK